VLSLWFIGTTGPDVLRKLRAPATDPAPVVFLDRADAPVLISDARFYLESVNNLPPPLAARLAYVGKKGFTDTIALQRLSRYRPLNVVDDLDALLAAHPRFHVIQGRHSLFSGWLVPDLMARGVRASLAADRNERQLLDIDRPATTITED
jgi:hypothetical protein